MSLLGIDVGTSGCKAGVFDLEGKMLSYSYEGYKRLYPARNMVEMDPHEIILAVKRVISVVAKKTKKDPIKSLSFSVFGGSLIPIDKKGMPLNNLISTTDYRAYPQFQKWEKEFGRKRTYKITGITPHPSFNLLKMLWFMEERQDIYPKIHKFLTLQEYLLINLGLDPVIDYSMASTIMAFDINKKDWSDEILSFARIDRRLLPEITPPGEIVGRLNKKIAKELNLPEGTPVVSGGHDQQVCALGAGLIKENIATDSLGTVECITVAFNKPEKKLLKYNYSNFCHVYKDMFVSLAYNYCAGDLLKWFRDNFCPGQSFEKLISTIPECPSDIFVLPHFSGSGTPFMDADSRGAILGLTLKSSKEDILRAIIESQNYEMKLNLELWKKAGIEINRLYVFGKGASVDEILQIKSDILNKPIIKLEILETGCFGAAALAGMGAGEIESVEKFLKKATGRRKVFHPRRNMKQTYEEKFRVYKNIYPALKNLTRI